MRGQHSLKVLVSIFPILNGAKALTAVCLHYNRSSTQRAVIIFCPLHNNDTSNAEDMSAPQPHRLVGDIEADRAEIII